MVTCEKAYIEKDRIFCKETKNFCGHVKFCQVSLKWDQVRSAETCPLRYAEPKKGKKRNAKK